VLSLARARGHQTVRTVQLLAVAAQLRRAAVVLLVVGCWLLTVGGWWLAVGASLNFVYVVKLAELSANRRAMNRAYVVANGGVLVRRVCCVVAQLR